LLERWPRWGGVGNLFATAAVGNDAQQKKGQDCPTSMPHFLLTFGDASRPPVGAVILEAPSMHEARMTAVARRLAPGVHASA
jgi:hypothetical protein